MGEEFSDLDLQRVKDIEPQTSNQEVFTENAESPESEELKNDGLEQAAIQDEASSSVPSNESLVSEYLESTNSSSEDASDLKRNSPVVKWDSPASTAEPDTGLNISIDPGQEESPDNQEIRPTTVSSRSLQMNRLRDLSKQYFEDVPNRIKDMFNSAQRRSEFSADSSGASTSSFYGEGSSLQAQTLQPPLQMSTPLHVDVTCEPGTSGCKKFTLDITIDGSAIAELGSDITFDLGSLLAIQCPKVSNGKSSTGEISHLNDNHSNHSSPTKRPRLQIEPSDSESSRDEVNISPEKENIPKSESETEDAEMNEQ